MYGTKQITWLFIVASLAQLSLAKKLCYSEPIFGDTQGYDISWSPTSTTDQWECTLKCDQEPRCVGVEWAKVYDRNVLNHNCWLKYRLRSKLIPLPKHVPDAYAIYGRISTVPASLSLLNRYTMIDKSEETCAELTPYQNYLSFVAVPARYVDTKAAPELNVTLVGRNLIKLKLATTKFARKCDDPTSLSEASSYDDCEFKQLSVADGLETASFYCRSTGSPIMEFAVKIDVCSSSKIELCEIRKGN